MSKKVYSKMFLTIKRSVENGIKLSVKTLKV